MFRKGQSPFGSMIQADPFTEFFGGAISYVGEFQQKKSAGGGIRTHEGTEPPDPESGPFGLSGTPAPNTGFSGGTISYVGDLSP